MKGKKRDVSATRGSQDADVKRLRLPSLRASSTSKDAASKKRKENVGGGAAFSSLLSGLSVPESYLSLLNDKEEEEEMYEEVDGAEPLEEEREGGSSTSSDSGDSSEEEGQGEGSSEENSEEVEEESGEEGSEEGEEGGEEGGEEQQETEEKAQAADTSYGPQGSDVDKEFLNYWMNNDEEEDLAGTAGAESKLQLKEVSKPLKAAEFGVQGTSFSGVEVLSSFGALSKPPATTRLHEDFAVLKRLQHRWEASRLGHLARKKAGNDASLTGLQMFVFKQLGEYRDLLWGIRAPKNSSAVRQATMLHVMNHIFKSLDIVYMHNGAIRSHAAAARIEKDKRRAEKLVKEALGEERKAEQKEGGEEEEGGAEGASETKPSGGVAFEHLDLRDQGFTRPKVLLLLPFRSTAMAYCKSMFHLCRGMVVKQKKRFETEFSSGLGDDPGTDSEPEEDVNEELAEDYKPEAKDRVEGKEPGKGGPRTFPKDHLRMFRGNIDDDFKLGIRFTTKYVKMYSNFYDSDLIIASPLGLRTLIGSEGDAGRDFDFLSSIEVVVIDQVDALMQQNWEHVTSVMKVLNLIPKSPRDTDFSRVRHWNLDGHARFKRQTIIMSRFVDPEVTGLLRRHCSNVKGAVVIRGRYAGVLNRVIPSVKQVFHRVPCSSLADSMNTRFTFFSKRVLPQVIGRRLTSIEDEEDAATMMNTFGSQTQEGTIIILPSYLEYVRLRNLLRKEDIEFGAIHEYTDAPEVLTMRARFFKGDLKLLLYTERVHFFRRYRIRGVRHVVFYGPPQHGHYYSEMLNQLEEAASSAKEPVSCITLFTKYDTAKLERVVGSDRVGRMVSPKANNIFMFM